MKRILLGWLALALMAPLTMLQAGGLLAAPPEPQSGPALGFHVAQGDAAHMAAARAAGGDFAVVVFSWRDIEPTPNYHYWEIPDATLRAAEYHGMQVIARLDRPPTWALDASSPASWSLDAYANFVRQVTQRYGARLGGVILWNEPNLALEWHDTRPDPTGYIALLAAGYQAVKAVAPALPVAAAGLAFTHGDGVNAVEDLAYLRQIYEQGGGAYFDVLAVHAYGFNQSPVAAPATEELNFRRLELHRHLMEEFGDSAKPVWITEMGWRSAAPNPADAWQVVTPEQQRDYTLAALARAATYPWLERIAFWEINAGPDRYGYTLWQGERQRTLAYRALVDRCRAAGNRCHQQAAGQPQDATPTISILAPDVTIRLGDRSELHPNWVHLYGGGERFSPAWRGEFFLTAAEAGRSYDLWLETMQIDQPTNHVTINGMDAGHLRPRTRPDPTSTWATQRLAIPAGMLTPGANTITVSSGPRNPARQYHWWRWENFQFRNLRLALQQPVLDNSGDWTPLPSPGGWSETNRIRQRATATDAEVSVWLTGNRVGQLWRLTVTPDHAESSLDCAATGALLCAPGNGPMPSLRNEAHNLSDHVIFDVADDGNRQVVATDQGLYWRTTGAAWQPVSRTPATPMYVVWRAADGWYAGGEQSGLWLARQPAGPWLRAGLTGRTLLDLTVALGRLSAATDRGVYVRGDGGWTHLPLPAAARGATAANFVPRLWPGDDDSLVVRSEDRLLRWQQDAPGWVALGSPDLAGRLYTVSGCCTPGTLAGSNQAGLWRLTEDGDWQRVDGNFFDFMEITGSLPVAERLFLATTNGFFASPSDGGGPFVNPTGLPATVTDLLADPANPERLLAGTPVGVFRSEDGGATWAPISPPWMVWDLAFGPTGRLYGARMDGVAWADQLEATPVQWQTPAEMASVTFFTVSPDPADPAQLWAGSWGNDIGVSTDGGATLRSLHNGLETLSVLSILRHPTPGQFTVGASEGLYRSDDGGESWFKLPGALATQSVYALWQTIGGAMLAGAADGLWRSDDYGASWQRVEQLAPVTVVRLGALGAATGNLLWAGTEGAGLWLSHDDGGTWQAAGLHGHTVYQVLTDPNDPQRLMVATETGIFVGAAAIGEKTPQEMHDRP